MKKFHGTPIGGTKKDAVMFLSGRDALISFYHKGHVAEVLDCCNSFVLDNGAFSHWKSGKGAVDVKAYAEWVTELQKHPAHYFSIIPDVIAGTEKQNDDLLDEWKRLGIRDCAPVYHLGESVDRFKRLASEYSIVCLGSTDLWPKNGSKEWFNLMADFMDEVAPDGSFPCKVHGLRMLDPNVFTRLPLHSADSTNAAVNGSIAMKKGILPALERWQGNLRIAQRIEHWQSARTWSRANLEQDLVSGNLDFVENDNNRSLF